MTGKAGVIATIADPAAARLYLVQGLGLARLATAPEAALRLVRLLANEGAPVPAAGFLADLEQILLEDAAVVPKHPPLAGIDAALIRRYEDHVLGRLFAEATVDRCSAALRRTPEEDRLRGVAFVARRLVERLGVPGVDLAPSAAREFAGAEEGRGAFEAGPMPEVTAALEGLIAAFRRAGELLGVEDAVALEQRTALGDLAQYVAHRQLLQLTARFEAALPAKLRPRATRREQPTAIRDEDQYPVGGYASIGTRGSLESLLHSQLAYMEPEGTPDLFDAKYVRDELFYYTRDENQFLRRRRAFGFHFGGDLAAARFKDAASPAQRLTLALAFALAAIGRLSQWLGEDALRFEVSLAPPLAAEAELLRILLAEPIRRGTCAVSVGDEPQWTALAREAQFHGLRIGVGAGADLQVGATPRLTLDGEPHDFGSWEEGLEDLLISWL